MAFVLMASAGLMIWGQARASGAALSLELTTLDGSRFVSLADFEGRPVLLNFWGSECPPCVNELPLLFAQARRHVNLQFLGVAVDQRAKAVRMLAQLNPGYPQLIAPANAEPLLRRFGNKQGVLPYTVVLNTQHQLCMTKFGEIDAAWIAAAASRCAKGATLG
jgi:thiol-disulfide isomerase/thioredoxin